MGQHWLTVNLDTRQAKEHGGKLGEFLFCLGNALETSIQVPPPLPNIDDLVRAIKPGDIVYKGYHSKNLDIAEPSLLIPKTATQSSRLVNLLVDMLHEIYAHLKRLANSRTNLLIDILSLSATCQALWEVGRSTMYHHIQRLASSVSWNGHRILCIGSSLDNSDIPENVFRTPEEEARFTDDGESALYEYNFTRVTGKPFNLDRVFLKLSQHWPRYYYRNMHAIDHLLVYSPPPPMARPTVLRNLTRKEYVRETALIDLKAKYLPVVSTGSYDLGEELQKVGMSEVLMTRICLASDPSVSMSYDGDIHQGAWVGDRFDIVSSAEWQVTASWTDVSDQVLKDLEDIWKSEFPPGRYS
ncbi:hypothetical protein R3P38DRAFT_2834802 [Favolaschia claudopus]|uniref:Uncharacterized protein n=1 Tax=Favolaschia claudopus TaxID=2862362 RepID=A0AAW0EE05_9AGAR